MPAKNQFDTHGIHTASATLGTIGAACALGALILAVGSRMLRGQHTLMRALARNHTRLNTRLDTVDATERRAITAISGILGAMEDELGPRRRR